MKVFLNDLDRNRLKEAGMEIAKDTMENIYEENFNIYKIFTTAEEKINISYASAESTGSTIRPSIFINKLKKMFPNLKEMSDTIKKEYEIVNEKVTYEELLEQISEVNDGKKIENLDTWVNVYQYFENSLKWQKKLKKDITALSYTNQPQLLKKENVTKLYGKTLKTSVSKLETFRACPFSYFMKYGLRIKEKEELKIQSFDTGSFLHNIIDNFFKEMQKESKGLAELEEEEIKKIVDILVEKELEDNCKYIFTATVKYKLLVQRLKKIINKAIKYIIYSLINSDFKVKGTEVEFGEGKKLKEIQLESKNGIKIILNGKIDRVDVSEKTNEKYVRIIDYKSSDKDIDFNKVYMGLQIQLITYLDAIDNQEQYIPAGIFYFPLIEKIIGAKKKITEEEIEKEIAKKFRMQGVILNLVDAIKMQDRTLVKNKSNIIPAGLLASGDLSERLTANGVDLEEFYVLRKYALKTIKDIADEILEGVIEIKPFKKGQTIPCTYCDYKDICGFDIKKENNSYRNVGNKSKDDILANMKNELEKTNNNS